jgi:hypothetical protein
LHTFLNDVHKYGYLLDSSDHTSDILLLEVSDGDLGISEDILSILNAGFNIGEALSIDGSLEDSTNDQLELLHVNLFLRLVHFWVLYFSEVLQVVMVGAGSSNQSGDGKSLHIC